MHCHCGTNNRAPRWTFMDPCKQEVRPGAREESASPACLAPPAMNALDTTKGAPQIAPFCIIVSKFSRGRPEPPPAGGDTPPVPSPLGPSWSGGLTLNVDRHYIGSVTATTHQEKGIK